MTARGFTDAIQEALESDDMDLFGEGTRCSTFGDVGLLTMNEGLVVRLANGDEFQVTVVQSQHGED